MTESIREYAGILSRAGYVTEPNVGNGFYAAEQQYITRMQNVLDGYIKNKIIDIDNTPGMGHWETHLPITSMIISGHLTGYDYAYIDALDKERRSGNLERTLAQRGMKADEIASILSNVKDFAEVIDFRRNPNSDWQKVKNQEPIAALKRILQETPLANGSHATTSRSYHNSKRQDPTYDSAPLRYNDKIADSDFPLAFPMALRRKTLEIQALLNKLDEFTGLPQIPETGQDSPEMQAAIKAFLQSPKALELAAQDPQFKKIRDSIDEFWGPYQKLTPEQIEEINSLFEGEIRAFTGSWAQAKTAQDENTSGKDFPAMTYPVDRKTGQVRENFDQIVQFYQNNSDLTNIREKLNDTDPGWFDSSMAASDDQKDRLTSPHVGHYLDALAFRQLQRDAQWANENKPVLTAEQQAQHDAITELQRYFKMNGRDFLGSQTPTFYNGIPLSATAINGQTDSLLTFSINQAAQFAQHVLQVNIEDPKFMEHIQKETGIDRAQAEELYLTDLDNKALKLIRAIESYPGRQELQTRLEGEKPEMITAAQSWLFKLTSALTDEQAEAIRMRPYNDIERSIADIYDVVYFEYERKPGEKISDADMIIGMDAARVGIHETIQNYTQRLINLSNEVLTNPNMDANIREQLLPGFKQMADIARSNHPEAPEGQLIRLFFEDYSASRDNFTGIGFDPQTLLIAHVMAVSPDMEKSGIVRSIPAMEQMNKALAALSDGQQEEFQKLTLTTLGPIKAQDKIIALKQVVNENIEAFNNALPDDLKITRMEPNGDFRHPDFLRMLMALDHLEESGFDTGYMFADARQTIANRMQDLNPVLPLIQPRALAWHLGKYDDTTFKDDTEALDSTMVLGLKQAIHDLSQSKLFSGISPFDPKEDMLNLTEPGFVKCIHSIKTAVIPQLAQLPDDVYEACAMSSYELRGKIMIGLNGLPPQDSMSLVFSHAANEISALHTVAPFLQEEFKNLPDGAVTVSDQGIAFDPSKMTPESLAMLQQITLLKINSIPAEYDEHIENMLLNVNYAFVTELAQKRQLALISGEDDLRIKLNQPGFLATLSPQERTAVLLEGYQDPNFPLRIISVPASMSHEEYVYEIANTVHNVLLLGNALAANPKLALALEAADDNHSPQAQLAQSPAVPEPVVTDNAASGPVIVATTTPVAPTIAQIPPAQPAPSAPTEQVSTAPQAPAAPKTPDETAKPALTQTFNDSAALKFYEDVRAFHSDLASRKEEEKKLAGSELTEREPVEFSNSTGGPNAVPTLRAKL